MVPLTHYVQIFTNVHLQRGICRKQDREGNLKTFSFLSLSFKLVVWMMVELKKSCVRESSWTRVKRNGFSESLWSQRYLDPLAFMGTFLWFPQCWYLPGTSCQVLRRVCMAALWVGIAGLSHLCSVGFFSGAGLWAYIRRLQVVWVSSSAVRGTWDKGGVLGTVTSTHLFPFPRGNTRI